jgi:hypothetical protein
MGKLVAALQVDSHSPPTPPPHHREVKEQETE